MRRLAIPETPVCCPMPDRRSCSGATYQNCTHPPFLRYFELFNAMSKIELNGNISVVCFVLRLNNVELIAIKANHPEPFTLDNWKFRSGRLTDFFKNHLSHFYSISCARTRARNKKLFCLIVTKRPSAPIVLKIKDWSPINDLNQKAYVQRSELISIPSLFASYCLNSNKGASAFPLLYFLIMPVIKPATAYRILLKIWR